MNPEDYTKEQRADIEVRVAKAQDFLKELQLAPQVIMQAMNVGDDVFGFKPVVYLQDQKYNGVLSPIQDV